MAPTSRYTSRLMTALHAWWCRTSRAAPAPAVHRHTQRAKEHTRRAWCGVFRRVRAPPVGAHRSHTARGAHAPYAKAAGAGGARLGHYHWRGRLRARTHAASGWAMVRCGCPLLCSLAEPLVVAAARSSFLSPRNSISFLQCVRLERQVTFAGEMLKQAEDLLAQGLHTSEIVAGYKTAADFTLALLPKLVCHSVTDVRDEAALVKVVRPVLMAKHLGQEDCLAALVARAALAVMPKTGKASMKAENVRIVKLIGGDISQSTVVNGMLLPRTVEGTITSVENAKITVFQCAIEAEGTETQGTVHIRNAEDMLNYNKSEEKALEDAIKAIAATGTNLVVTGGTSSDMALHFLEKYKIMVVKCPSKWDLRRLCATVGATALVRMGPATPEEMGACHKVNRCTSFSTRAHARTSHRERSPDCSLRSCSTPPLSLSSLLCLPRFLSLTHTHTHTHTHMHARIAQPPPPPCAPPRWWSRSSAPKR